MRDPDCGDGGSSDFRRSDAGRRILDELNDAVVLTKAHDGRLDDHRVTGRALPCRARSGCLPSGRGARAPRGPSTSEYQRVAASTSGTQTAVWASPVSIGPA